MRFGQVFGHVFEHHSGFLKSLGKTALPALALTALGPAISQAAQVSCTPTAGFHVCWKFTYSGADQTFTVPAGITTMDVRVWGAAGGGANSAWYSIQSGGAAGGFSKGTLAVTPGQALTIVVGQGGIMNGTASTYGGGGAGGDATTSTAKGASGGGMSALFLPGTKSAANALLIAGGGGGASPGADSPATTSAGGGGGVSGGQDLQPANSGRGGTQVAGGAAGTTGTCATEPTAGSQFQGGRGGTTNSWEGGGGGGGGWYGGGGGKCQQTAANGAGGGGSGYISGPGVTAASTSAGANFPFAGSSCAGTAASAGATDPLYTTGIGLGSCYGNGGSGQIVIQYARPTLTLAKISLGGTGTFTFTGSNGWISQNISTSAPGASVSGATQILAAAATATSITEAMPAGYQLSSISCADTNSAANGNTGTFGSIAGNVATIPAANIRNNSIISCTLTNTKTPTVAVQKKTLGGTGGSFTFTQTNLSATPAAITTSVVSTPTPASPVASNVLSIGTAVTVTEAPLGGWFLSGASCTDSNSAITGNTGLIGTVSGTTLTIPGGNVRPGSVFSCIFTNTKGSPSLRVVKTASTVGPVAAGQSIGYTYAVTNTGNVPISNVQVGDAHLGNGIAPVPGTETLITDAAPSGDSTDTTTNGTWDSLGPGDTIRFTSFYSVVQADIDQGP